MPSPGIKQRLAATSVPRKPKRNDAMFGNAASAPSTDWV